MRRALAVLATLTCAILGLVATSAAAMAPARAVVIKADVSPSRLGVSGGHVEVTGTVSHAMWCQLKLLSRLSVVVVYSHNPKSCATGKYSARVLIGSDTRTKDRTVAFALVARNKTSSSTQRVVLTLAEPAGLETRTTTTAPKPGEGSTGATTSSTSTTVGTTTTSGPVTTTTPVIILPELPAPTTTTGTTVPSTTTTAPTTTTTTGPTTTTGATGTSTTSTTTSPSTTTTLATTTTTGPTTTTTGPTTEVVNSSNWSGYAVGNGPYNRIVGTFTVPAITAAATCTEHVAEWVGIDGWNVPGLAYNGSLIQAGVDGSMTDPDTGTCTAGKFWVWPWWEILPKDETPIATVTVSSGDQVTVSISQTEASTWAITLTDDTNGQSYTTDQSYSGPGASGEWVVEASSTSACYGSVVPGSDICQLAPYCVTSGASCTGAVPFSGMSINGPEASWWQVYMVQNGATVAIPSVLGDNGFSVAYAGTQAGISSPTGESGPVLTAGSQPRDKVLRQPVSAG